MKKSKKVLVEIFKPIHIDGEISKYIISDHGTCINTKTGLIIKSWIGKKGKRRYLTLYHKNKPHTKQLARWIALSFLKLPFGNNYNVFDADHIDENPLNDILTNIQWLTKKDNYKKTILLNPDSRKGEKCLSSKLTEDDVHSILNDARYNNMTNKDICIKYNLHPSTVSDIIHGRTWKHIYLQYNMENFSLNSKLIYFTENQRQMIKEYLNKGLSPREIVIKLNLPIDNNTLKRIRYYKIV